MMENPAEEKRQRRFRAPGLHGWVREGWAFESDPKPLLARLDAEEAVICKDRPKVKAGCIAGYFIKRYNTTGFFNAVRRRFRPPRPMRAMRAERRLRRAGISTPEVFAALRATRFGLPVCDFLVTAALAPEMRSALDLIRQSVTDDYRPVLEGMAALMVKMHASGVAHGDLNLRNLYCRENGGRLEAWGVIDLDGARFFSGPLPAKHRRRELARAVSSLLRARPELKLRAGEVLEAFAAKYETLSGINLRCGALRARTRYLTERIRRDQR